MRRFAITAIAAISLADCGGGGGNNPPPLPPPQSTGWMAFNSPGISRCDDFDFGELHYCTKQQLRPQLGQTISITFTVSGSGSLYPTGAGDILPAKITLFLWRRNDPLTCIGQYRYWSAQRLDLVVNATQTFSVQVDPSQWTDCYGHSAADDPASFQTVLNDLVGVGYTMGGAYFAGHGVAANGPVHFKLQSFTIDGQNYGRKRKRK